MISKILLLCCAFVLCTADPEECGRVTPEGGQLVVGGKNTQPGGVPWHVSIYKKTTEPFKNICGGSLVSNTVVLSVAHCFSGGSKKLPASEFAVAAGKLHRPWDDKTDVDAQKSDVKEVHTPSLFQGEAANFQDDIAVVIVVTPFVYKPSVSPICLDFDHTLEKQQLQPGNYGKVVAWSFTDRDSNVPAKLKVVDVPYIDVTTCIGAVPANFREYITSDKFCGNYTNGTVICKGDGGNGLAFPNTELGIERYYLRGIVSTAPSYDDTCNGNTYTLFTAVAKHEYFIKEYIS